MGLDMYLYRLCEGQTPEDVIRYLNEGDWDYSDPNWLDQWREYKAGVEVAYWRKANAIHAWFVDAFQDGIDECEPSKPFGREALAGLVEKCQRILDGRARPETLLPSRSGFFFGGTEYDESYEYDLKETIRQLEPLLAERNGDSFFYQSSW